MKCWVCKRQARGLGHSDNRHGIGRAQRYPLDWVFCSPRCQSAFHALYGNWTRAQDGRSALQEVTMLTLSDIELGATRQCLKAFGTAASSIGFSKSLGDYTEAEALRVIEAIVTCFSEAMVAYHEQSKFPPVRGLPMTADPMATDAVASPFADMAGDTPWEATP